MITERQINRQIDRSIPNGWQVKMSHIVRAVFSTLLYGLAQALKQEKEATFSVLVKAFHK